MVAWGFKDFGDYFLPWKTDHEYSTQHVTIFPAVLYPASDRSGLRTPWGACNLVLNPASLASVQTLDSKQGPLSTTHHKRGTEGRSWVVCHSSGQLISDIELLSTFCFLWASSGAIKAEIHRGRRTDDKHPGR